MWISVNTPGSWGMGHTKGSIWAAPAPSSQTFFVGEPDTFDPPTGIVEYFLQIS